MSFVDFARIADTAGAYAYRTIHGDYVVIYEDVRIVAKTVERALVRLSAHVPVNPWV